MFGDYLNCIVWIVGIDVGDEVGVGVMVGVLVVVVDL